MDYTRGNPSLKDYYSRWIASVFSEHYVQALFKEIPDVFLKMLRKHGLFIVDFRTFNKKYSKTDRVQKYIFWVNICFTLGENSHKFSTILLIYKHI